MSVRDRWVAILVAVAGLAVCVTAVSVFVHGLANNNLSWHSGQSAREFYLAIGDSYSEGFIVGFFLCFFLVLVAVAVSSWVRQRRSRLGRSDRLLDQA